MASVYAYIDGVDYGPTSATKAIQGLATSTTGIDKIGTASILLTFTSGALPTITPTREVKIYSTGGTPVGYFGGFIMRDGINIFKGPGAQRFIRLECTDYNELFDRIINAAASASAITVSAGTMAAQVSALVLAMQRNGHGSVSQTIDTTSYVTNLTGATVLPTFTVSGESLRQGMRKIMVNAMAANSALRPRFNLQLLADGLGGVTCALVVWDGASPGSSAATFSTTPTGIEWPILEIQQTDDAALPITNWRQSIWDAALARVVSTYAGATSGATYYNQYINDGIGPGGASGYWKDIPIKDTQSTTSAEAQNNIDIIGRSKEYPRQTFQVAQRSTYIRAGQAVTIKTDKINSLFEVTGVDIEWPNLADPTEIRYTMTCGLPLLELFDDGYDGIAGPPIIGDNVAPLPPASFTVTQNYYDPDTGDANMHFSIGASPSPDVAGYKLKGFVGHQNADLDVGTNVTLALVFPSGLAYSFQAYAYDSAGNESDATPSSPLTGTTAVPTYDTVPNSDFDVFDRLDTTLHRNWSRIAVAGGTAVYNTASNTGPACAMLTTTGSLGSAISYQSSLTVAKGTTYAEVFWAKANSGTPSITVTYKWYDNTQAYLSGQDTTFLKTLSTSWARYTGTMTKPSAGAFFRVMYSIVSLSTIVRVDTTSHTPQTPNDGIEVITDASKVALVTDATAARYMYDSTGVIRGKEYTTPTVMHYDGVNTGGSAPVSVSISSTTTDNLFLAANGADTLLASSTGLQLTAASGHPALLSAYAGAANLTIGNGANTMLGSLTITGALASSAAFIQTGMETKTSTFTVDDAAYLYLCNSASAITVNLPAASTVTGHIYVIKNINTGKATIDPNSSETIDGITTYPLVEKYQSVTIISDGSNWRIIDQSGLILESDGTRWLGPEIPVPVVNYQGSQAYSANTEAYACAAFSDYTFLVTRMELAYHVFTTNNGSNYWTADFRRLTSGISFSTVASVDTSGGTNDTWTHPTADTSFSNNPTATNDIFWQVYVSKTGSPGNAFLIPTVFGRKVYT